MLNPIVKNRNYIVAYIVIWGAIFLIQAFVINFFYDVEIVTSIVDSAVFNTLFALIGFNLWYVIRYNLKETPNVFDLLINHLIVAVLAIAGWITVSYFLLIYIFPDAVLYRGFLNNSLPWRVITGIFYYLLFIMYYYVMLYYEDLQEKLKVEAELKILVNAAELTALKSQINPHFLFNSLNSISSLTITNPEKAQEMVIKLSDFLRYTLSHDKDEMTSLKEEFGNLNRYVDIEKIRFGSRLNFHANIPKNCYDIIIPNMILQPLVENAIKHGVYNSLEEVLVELTCKHEQKYIIIKISNEYDPDLVNKKGNGIGLTNIKKRLELTYKRRDLLKISADKLIFNATLRIPTS